MEKEIWKRFVDGETQVLNQLPSKVATSWEFCLNNQVNPFANHANKQVAKAALRRKQKTYQPLIQMVDEVIACLEKKFEVSAPLLVLTDNEGTILWRTGEHHLKDFANTINFREGSQWSELEVGTNAIAMVLRTKESESLSSEEHYATASRSWSCAAAPILDEHNEILAVLDISSYKQEVTKELLLLLAMITEKVMYRLLKQNIQERNELLAYAKNDSSDEVLCDKHSRIIRGPKNDSQRLGIKEEQKFPGIKSKSAAYQGFLKQVLQVAPSSYPVHIYGESGSGKEIIAQTIHQNSTRADGPMIAVNCGALSDSLLESELFGYAAGAFTGANEKGFKGKISQADRGTLFLDEIDSMPERMQQALLRVLEDKLVTPINGKPVATDFRLITASNQDLRALVQAGKFREDLFYRLFVCAVQIPPLRERLEDLDLLVQRFAQKNRWDFSWSSKIVQVAKKFPWYGNIREFNNFLARTALFYPKKEPSETELTNLILMGMITKEDRLGLPLFESEKIKIQEALEKNHFNLNKTAQELAISRTTLYRKIKKYQLSV